MGEKGFLVDWVPDSWALGPKCPLTKSGQNQRKVCLPLHTNSDFQITWTDDTQFGSSWLLS